MSDFWVKLQIPAAIITTILLLDSTFNHFNFSKSSHDIFEMGAPGKKMNLRSPTNRKGIYIANEGL